MTTTDNQVDLFASAKDAQWNAAMQEAERSYRAVAPAKINLFLDIGQLRDDGYHDVVNIMHTLSLHDVLHIGISSEGFIGQTQRFAGQTFERLAERNDVESAGQQGNILVKIDIADKVAGIYDTPLHVPAKDNLIFKAIDVLANKFAIQTEEFIEVHLEKNVPHQAGLGGGSSDAASILVTLANHWNIDLQSEDFLNAARSIGADVAFFLKGGCARFEGAGEILTQTLISAKDPLVIVKPASGISTSACYKAFDKNPQRASNPLLEKAMAAQEMEAVPLFNSLEKAAYSIDPDLERIHDWLDCQEGIKRSVCTQDAPGVARDVSEKKSILLTGSGAATFAIAESYNDAMRIASHATSHGWWARPSHLCALRASLTPGK